MEQPSITFHNCGLFPTYLLLQCSSVDELTTDDSGNPLISQSLAIITDLGCLASASALSIDPGNHLCHSNPCAGGIMLSP
ncbi:hypothetical protein TNCV_3430201 [Trichonephila clavipes]|nr:hypothetical protein TNCV_3430201 [Trichonephila clavipes]